MDTPFEEFQKNEVSFVSIQENIDFSGPIGRLIFQMFGAIAQFERELIRGRTYAGILTSAEQGNYIGRNVPFGYCKAPNKNGKGSKLEIIPKERKWVTRIYDWYVYKQWGDQRIADELNRLKVPLGSASKHSVKSRWTEKKIRFLLPNPIYFGKHIAIKKDENGKLLSEEQQTVVFVPPCVSETLFRQAGKARGSRTGGYAKTSYMLSGKLRDISPDLPSSLCFIGARRTKGGFSYRRKRFLNQETGKYHPTLEIPGQPLDDFVWKKILSAFRDPSYFIEKYVQMNKHGDHALDRIEEKLQVLRKREIEITEIEHPNLEKALIKGVFEEQQYKGNCCRLDRELNEIQTEIQVLEGDMEGLIWTRNEIQNFKQASTDVFQRLESLNQEQRRILCDLFVERVEICKTEIPGKKRKIQADIFFRFNLSRLQNPEGGGVRTQIIQSESTQTAVSKGKTALNGAEGRSGYIPIKIAAYMRKSLTVSHSNGRRYCHIKSEWIEK